MPVVPVQGGFKIRRSAGGLYPKVYSTRAAASLRVAQMETYKQVGKSKRKGKYPVKDSYA